MRFGRGNFIPTMSIDLRVGKGGSDKNSLGWAPAAQHNSAALPRAQKLFCIQPRASLTAAQTGSVLGYNRKAVFRYLPN